MSIPRDSIPDLAGIEAQLDQLRTRHERDRRALDLLYRVGMACRGLASDRAIFDVLCRELRGVFALDSCYIALCDLEHPDVFRTALLYDEGLVEYAEQIEFGPITERMIRERVPILIPDLDEIRSDLRQRQTTFGNKQKLSRAWMGVPLLLGQDALGMIALQSYTPNRFGEADHELLQRIGQMVAVALENANLIQRQRNLSDELAARVAARTEELAALGAIAAEMVLQQPLPVLLDRALGHILPLLDVAAGNLRLYDRERETLLLLAQRGLPPDDPRAVAELPVSGSLFGTIVRDNLPLVIERDLMRHALRKTPSDFESLLGIPLRIGDQVIGSMALLDVKPRAFAPQQIDLAQLIGNQLAIAIQNARLLDQRERQIQELRALGAISQAANTSLNLRMLLRQVYEALHGLMPLDAFVMTIYDPDREVVIEGIGIDEGETYEYYDSNEPLPPESFSAWVVRNRRMLHLRDVAEEIGAYPELDRLLAGSGRPSASWLGVPMYDREEHVIGTIVVQSYTAGAFGERDERFLESVARQASLHVWNLMLLAQRERQIRELDAIGRIGRLVSASFDLDGMLRIV